MAIIVTLGKKKGDPLRIDIEKIKDGIGILLAAIMGPEVPIPKIPSAKSGISFPLGRVR